MNELREALMDSISEVEESSPGSTGRLGEIAESSRPEPLAREGGEAQTKQQTNDEKSLPTKGADGKFQKAGPFQKQGQLPPKKAAPVEQLAQAKDKNSAQSAQQEPPKNGEAPSNLPPDVRAEWAALSPAMKAFVTRRETEHSQSAGKIGREMQQLKDKLGPLEEVIGSRSHAWTVAYGSPAAGLKYLTDVSDFATNDPQGFMAWFLTQPDISSKVDLQKLFGPAAPQGQAAKPADPVVAELQKKLQGLERHIQQSQSAQQQQSTRTLASELDAFEQEKDGAGNLAHPYFAEVRDHPTLGAGKGPMVTEMQLVKREHPEWSNKQIVTEAYERTVWKHSDTRGKMQSDAAKRAQSEAEAKDRADRAKLARKSVAGSPPGRQQPINGADSRSSLRADIESAWTEANSKGPSRL